MSEEKKPKDEKKSIIEEEKVAKAEKPVNKTEDYLSNWKRAQADFENYKKDQVKRMEEFRKFASLDFVLQILPVIDNFEISLEHIPENKKDDGWVQGILHIKKQLEDILKNNGVEEIETGIGDIFNPEIHEAVSDSNRTNERTNAANTIKKVMQKGYKIDGKVIRAARVIVE